MPWLDHCEIDARRPYRYGMEHTNYKDNAPKKRTLHKIVAAGCSKKTISREIRTGRDRLSLDAKRDTQRIIARHSRHDEGEAASIDADREGRQQ